MIMKRSVEIRIVLILLAAMSFCSLALPPGAASAAAEHSLRVDDPPGHVHPPAVTDIRDDWYPAVSSALQCTGTGLPERNPSPGRFLATSPLDPPVVKLRI